MGGHITTKSRLRSHLLGAAPPFEGVAGGGCYALFSFTRGLSLRGTPLSGFSCHHGNGGKSPPQPWRVPPFFWEFNIRLAHVRDGAKWALAPALGFLIRRCRCCVIQLDKLRWCPRNRSWNRTLCSVSACSLAHGWHEPCRRPSCLGPVVFVLCNSVPAQALSSLTPQAQRKQRQLDVSGTKLRELPGHRRGKEVVLIPG